jgi:DNA (cytosine-5)-methyltransferase 1
MRYLSVCSGIEAATVAWHPLGWETAAFSEIEKFPRAVLAHHYPGVPLHGDFTTIEGNEYGPVDLLVGGTPCQDFSVAGLRAGLAGDRGNLTLEFLRLAGRIRPVWLVWENVPGVLSIDGGRAFGAVLGGLAELGYGFAYRVLDAQYFGLAQRRARVFVVGYLGDWRRAAAVLFERESLLGNPAPRREAREGIAPTLSARTKGGGGLGTDFDCDGGLIAPEVSLCLNAGGMGRQDSESETLIAHALRAEGFDASEDGTGRGTPLVAHAFDARQSDVIQYGDKTGPVDTDGYTMGVYTLAVRGRGDGHNLEYRQDGTANAVLTPNGGRAGIGVGAVAFNITPSQSNKDYNARQSERAQAVTGGGNRPSARGGDVIVQSAVRRLTPRECERLQGFPDDYTLVTYRGKSAADGPRYKALGNSMAVPVMRWIGERIAMVERIARAA